MNNIVVCKRGEEEEEKKVPFFKIPGASVGVCVCICLEGARRAPVAVLLSSRVHLLRSENIEIKKTTRPCDFLSVVHSVLFDSFADCVFFIPLNGKVVFMDFLISRDIPWTATAAF